MARLTDAERDEAKRLLDAATFQYVGLSPTGGVAYLSPDDHACILGRGLYRRALAELEALRAERAARTGQAVPGILRQREPPRPQRRKRG